MSEVVIDGHPTVELQPCPLIQMGEKIKKKLIEAGRSQEVERVDRTIEILHGKRPAPMRSEQAQTGGSLLWP